MNSSITPQNRLLPALEPAIQPASGTHQRHMFLRRMRRWGLAALALMCLLAGSQRVASTAYLLAKAKLAETLIAQAWKTSRLTGQPVKPWPWADTHPVARLRVPRLKIGRILLAEANDRTLAFGGAHVAGSGWPGQGHSVVFAGHRDSHFAFLEKLKPGDVLELETDRRYRYRVSSTAIVDSRQQQIPLADREQLLLTTCYPFHRWQAGGPLRYLVTAEPLPENTSGRPREK